MLVAETVMECEGGERCSFVKMRRAANILGAGQVTSNMKSSLGLFSVCCWCVQEMESRYAESSYGL